MGIKGAHGFTHSISEVSIGELYQIGLSRRKFLNDYFSDNINSESNEDIAPIIDIDTSWVYRSSTISLETRLNWMINLSIELVKTGFIVYFICDGNIRHHSKRASVERRSKIQRRIFEGYIMRAKLMDLGEKRKQSTSADEINTITIDENILSKKIIDIQNQEQTNNVDVGEEFVINLTNLVAEIDYKKRGIQKKTINVVQALYQADLVIAYRMLNGCSTMMLSNDSDLAALCGELCVGIKAFKFNERTNKGDRLSNFVLYTPVSDTLRNITESIHLASDSTRIKMSKFAIFENIGDIKIRGLLAVGLGCDVYLPGVHMLGKALLKKFILNENEITYDKVINFYFEHTQKIMNRKNMKKKDNNKANVSNKKKKSKLNACNILKTIQINDVITDDVINNIDENNLSSTNEDIENISRCDKEIRAILNDDNFDKLDAETIPTLDKDSFEDALNIFVDAFIYEPANYFPNTFLHNNALYLPKEKPKKLHQYLKSFGYNDPDVEIYESNNKLIECSGSGFDVHTFLSFETSYTCCFCNEIICKYCCMNNDKKDYCHKCFLSEVSVVPTNISQVPSLRDMRASLLETGIETTNEDNIQDISDLYEAVVESKKFDTYVGDDLLHEISVPLLSSDYLETEKVTFRFDLKDGGGFIRNSSLSLNNKFDIIILMGKLVQTGKNEYLNKNAKTHTILPDLIVTFAERARLHTGHRLLKRAIRHAMDPAGNSIMSSHCSIIEYNGILGLHINQRVKASMKSASYEVHVSFTRQDIIAVSCTCKAGSCGSEKVLCVHILPLLLQLSLLLFDGLAEHLLIEIANDLKPHDDDCLREDEKKVLRHSIQLLRRATSEIDEEFITNSLSIHELLKIYNVGTENFKRGPGPPTKNDKALGPLRDLSFISPLMQIENIINKKENIINNSQNNTTNINNDVGIDYIPYNKIMSLINILKNHFRNQSSTINDCVGFKVLTYRSNEQEDLSSKQINMFKRKLLVAIKDASNEYRFTKTTPKKYSPNVDDLDTTPPYDDGPDDTNINNVNNEDNINNNTNCKNTNNNIKATINRISNRTCCAFGCNNTSNNAPETKYTRVPPFPQKIANIEQSTNMKIETNFRKRFIRKEWNQRLGLLIHNQKGNLYICTNHELELQLTEYIWRDINNNEQRTIRQIKLPIHRDAPPLKTRQQHAKRKAVSIISPLSKRNKTNITTINENNNIKTHKYCVFVGCRFNNSLENINNNVCFYCVPKMPPDLKHPATNYQLLQHAKKVDYRRMFLKSIGRSQHDKRSDIRICNNHQKKTVRSLLHWNDKNGIKNATAVSYDLPSVSSDNNKPTDFQRPAKGLGIDRFLCKTINKANEEIKKVGNENLAWAMAVQQTVAMTEGTLNVHPSVAKAVGINVHKPERIIYKINNRKKGKERTSVRLNDLTDDEIKSQTGFENKTTIISYIIILCNGDLELMTKRTHKLTWWEEWYFYFEYTYGRSAFRWIEFVRKYKRSEAVLRILYKEKLKIALTCRNKWPIYCSMAEDEIMRSKQWEKTYAGKRVVMWDNTCIRLSMPQDSETQRSTYSLYYSGNVAKGAIFIQLCGWMGTHELWAGAVSDSDYLTRSGILQQQAEYIPKYDASNIDIQWMIVLDKGYRVTSAAWRTGKQFVLQPSFARSDKKFTTLETLRSAAVAHDRGANERAVRLSKMSKHLKEGRTGNKCIERLSDMWLTWSFQCNFIYKPVL